MFDLNSDMFKPKIRTKLICDEGEKQVAPKQLDEIPAKVDINPFLPLNEVKTLLQRQEIQNKV